MPYEQDLTISVSDTKGKVIFSEHESGKLLTFKTSTFPRGAYLVNVSNKNPDSSIKHLLK
ncbi:MAG: T9SS type A sorting domain-containing protein [Paludibacter sp.]|nr:T9SS type A sorting domain-containing protein [Paludibacter sp.]